FLLFCTYPAPTEIYTLSLHDALPISSCVVASSGVVVERIETVGRIIGAGGVAFKRLIPVGRVVVASVVIERIRTGSCVVDTRLRSEEHTSELQSLAYLVCRLLLEKKK